MKSMKKLAALLLVLALIFTAVGCGSKGASSSSSGNTLRVVMQDPNVPIDTNMGTQAYL